MGLPRQRWPEDWLGRWGSGSPAVRWTNLLALASVAALLTGCGGGGDSPPAVANTAVYLLTSCRQAGAAMTIQQDLRVLVNETETVTVFSVGPLGPFAGVGCGLNGFNRWVFNPRYGPVQRFGITSDGSGVAFDLTDEFVVEGQGLLPLGDRGIYYVRTDGSGLQRLGPASRSPAWWLVSGFGYYATNWLSFDPTGQQFAYVDLGPDDADHEAAQVFVRGLTPGDAAQVTRMPAHDDPVQTPEIAWPYFIDGGTILFGRFSADSVVETWMTTDLAGTVSEVPTVSLGGGYVVPTFQIVGEDWIGLTVSMPGEPLVPHGTFPITEVFVVDGSNVLQLTSFRRTDTAPGPPYYSARDQRVYFSASANPLGKNPTENCQLFSIDPLGGHLRQLTFFSEGSSHATNGCFAGRRGYGCQVHRASQQPNTGTLLFKSSCDPRGQNLNGWQLFAMQPDGSNLRQVTNASGYVRLPDGTVEVESVDVYQSPTDRF